MACLRARLVFAEFATRTVLTSYRGRKEGRGGGKGWIKELTASSSSRPAAAAVVACAIHCTHAHVCVCVCVCVSGCVCVCVCVCSIQKKERKWTPHGAACGPAPTRCCCCPEDSRKTPPSVCRRLPAFCYVRAQFRTDKRQTALSARHRSSPPPREERINRGRGERRMARPRNAREERRAPFPVCRHAFCRASLLACVIKRCKY